MITAQQIARYNRSHAMWADLAHTALAGLTVAFAILLVAAIVQVAR